MVPVLVVPGCGGCIAGLRFGQGAKFLPENGRERAHGAIDRMDGEDAKGQMFDRLRNLKGPAVFTFKHVFLSEVLLPGRHLAPVMALGCLLSACANQHAQDAVRAQSTLLGLPKQALLSCAGAPTRIATSDSAEYYTYVNRSYSGGFAPSIGIGVGGFGSNVGGGVGLGFPFPSGPSESTCEATFTVQKDTVTQLTYRGGPDNGLCYAIVQNCLAQAPTPSR